MATCRELPAVDVVVLSWNRARLTIDAVESALQQQGVPVQVIVLDQGSRPDQREELRAGLASRAGVALLEVPENLGVPGGRNLAANRGTSPYVMHLDNDAVFDDPTTLCRAVEYMEDHPRTAIASLRVLDHDTEDDDERSFTFPRPLRAQSHCVHRVAKFLGGAALMRRRVIEEVGGLDDSLFFGGEEVDLAFRVINAGYAIDYLGPMRIRHRPPTAETLGWDEERFYYFVRNGTYVWEKAVPSRLGISARTAGALLQAARCGHAGQGVRGWLDGRRMLRRLGPGEREAARLGPVARAYLRRYQLDLEGSLFSRVRQALTPR